MTAHVPPSREAFARFREAQRKGPAHMLNLLRFRARAAHDDGTEATGEEAYRAYARESGPVLERPGGRQVWLGVPKLAPIGPEDEAWDLAFVAEYPCVAAFVEVLRAPVYRAAVHHRTAAVADSRLIRMRPRPPGRRFGEGDAG